MLTCRLSIHVERVIVWNTLHALGETNKFIRIYAAVYRWVPLNQDVTIYIIFDFLSVYRIIDDTLNNSSTY